MKRRSFLAGTAACTALICSQQIGIAFAQQPRIRRNVTSPEAAQDIATLREGVKILLANQNAENYASWMYWANSHGMPGDSPSHMRSVWKRCKHGNAHFLSWHRAYLYYFEELIRQVTKHDSFALPYWDWYSSTAIPKAFTDTPLSHSPRKFSERILIADAMQAETFEEFSFKLEGNPHGTVHIMVGGDMGNPNTAGRDPLFWVHHCNVDRLWELWRNSNQQNQNPTNEAWLSEKFAFDTNGTKQMEARKLVNIRELGYIYESAPQPETGTVAAIPKRPARVIEASPFLQESGDINSSGSRVLSRSEKIVLSAESLSVKFNISTNDSVKLAATPESSESSPPALTVQLKELQITKQGELQGFEYQFYVNLPTKTEGASHETFYAGSLTSFQVSGHEHHSAAELTIPLQGTIRRLISKKLWSNSEILLSIVSTQDTTVPLLTIGRVELVLNKR